MPQRNERSRVFYEAPTIDNGCNGGVKFIEESLILKRTECWKYPLDEQIVIFQKGSGKLASRLNGLSVANLAASCIVTQIPEERCVTEFCTRCA
jgi:hypothetical protein